MKLRMQGNSLRLRITPSEMTQLIQAGRIHETVHFAADPDAHITYALEHSGETSCIGVRYFPGEIVVIVPSEVARDWASTQTIGLYGEAQPGAGALPLALDPAFACLDKSDADNADRFPNPKQGSIC